MSVTSAAIGSFFTLRDSLKSLKIVSSSADSILLQKHLSDGRGGPSPVLLSSRHEPDEKSSEAIKNTDISVYHCSQQWIRDSFYCHFNFTVDLESHKRHKQQQPQRCWVYFLSFVCQATSCPDHLTGRTCWGLQVATHEARRHFSVLR